MEENNASQVQTGDNCYLASLPSGRSIFEAEQRETRNFIRPQGQKSFLNVGSWLEEKQIDSLSQERHQLLSEVRAQKPSELGLAEWDPDRKTVILRQSKRHILEYMGKTHGDETTLHRLEALFLLDSCQLQLMRCGLPLSLEEAYEILLEDEDDMNRYQVYAHLIRGGYTVVPHQGSINVSSYEKAIGLDRYKVHKSHVEVFEDDSESDIVCLDDDEQVSEEENQECKAEYSSDSDIEILDVIPAKQPKLERHESSENENSVEAHEIDAQNTDKNCANVSQNPQNGADDDGDVVFLSSIPSQHRPCHQFYDGQRFGDCVVIKLDKTPDQSLDFPIFNGHTVTVRCPPPHLLPRTVAPSKEEYVLNVDAMRRECLDKCVRSNTCNDFGNNVSSWRTAGCHRGRWRGQWSNEHHARYGEPSYHREHLAESNGSRGQDSWQQGRDWGGRGGWARGRGWYRGAEVAREECWYRGQDWTRDWHCGQVREQWWRQDAREFRWSSSRESYNHQHRAYAPPDDHNRRHSPSSWSHNNRWSSPSTSKSQSGGATSEEDAYISVIPKVGNSVSSWVELKAEANRRLNVSTLASGEGAVLWRGKVKPLVMPSKDLSITGIMSQLAVTKEVDFVHGKCKTGTEPKTDLKIDFDVYVPGCTFRKADPTLPEHRVVCRRLEEGPPTLSDVAALQKPLLDDVPLVFATMDGGSCLMYSIDSISVPNFAPKT